MVHPLYFIADRWVSRRAAPRAAALDSVSGLAPCVLVTGASRGIGYALAARFARAGHHIAMVARNAAQLHAAAEGLPRAHGVRIVAVPLDVTAADAPQQLETALREQGFYADLLINNAGIGLSGPFGAQGADQLDRLIALNISAATRLMRHALEPMIARGRGGILNVGSLGGLVPGPHQAAYYASKAYLVSLTEAVAHEERGRGVRIAVVAPGPVDTGFHRAMRADGALYRTIVPALSAETAAASAYRGYMLGRTVIVPGILPTATALAVRILPHAITVPLVGALLAPVLLSRKR